jgi:hypothetical protein
MIDVSAKCAYVDINKKGRFHIAVVYSDNGETKDGQVTYNSDGEII